MVVLQRWGEQVGRKVDFLHSSFCHFPQSGHVHLPLVILGSLTPPRPCLLHLQSQPFWSELLILLTFSYLQIPGQVPPPTRSFPLCYNLEVVVCAQRVTVLPLGPQRGDVRDGGTFKR